MAYTPANPLQAVEALYIGYFGRAGEPGGVQYWIDQINKGQTFAQVAAAFSVQSEAKAQHPFLANPSLVSPADFVESLYSQLFGRASDATGKAYWVAQLQAANGNPFAYGLIVAQFISGAQGDDITVIQNKVAAAEYFTGKLASAGISGTDANGQVLPATDAAATDVISGVTKDTASIDASKTKTDAFVSGGQGGTTFTFTNQVDNLNGTQGNDTFIGDNTSVSAGDTVNGGSGIDTVKLFGLTAGNLPNLNSVENVYLNAPATGLTFDVSTKAGVTSVELDGGAAATTLNVGAAQAVKVTNLAAGNTVTVSGNTPTSLGLTLDKVGSATGGNGNVTLTGTSLATVNATATSNSFVTLTGPASLKTLNVDGAGVLKLDTAVALTTIDASKSTGGINVNSIGASNLTFTGSAKNDTIKLGGSLTTADVIAGGEGTDTIGITVGSTLVDGLKVTGFETLDIAGSGAALANNYDLDKLAGITTLKVGGTLNTVGGGGDVATINNLAKGAAVEIGGALTDAGVNLTDGLIVNVKGAGAGSPNDVISVNFNAATAVTTNGFLQISDIETVNLTSTSTGTNITHTVTKLDVANALTVNVNASTAGLTITDLNDAALVLFDASASAKAVSLTTGNDAFAATTGVSFKLGAAADTINLTGATTAGAAATTLDFSVQGNGGGDNITLATAGGGFDKVVIAAATDSQVGVTSTGAAKFDTVTNFVATAEDKLDLTAFGFTGGQQAVSTSTAGVNANGELLAANDAFNFFTTAGNKTGVTELQSGADLWVYIDVNKDGNLDAGDAALKLVGVTAANFDATDIIWA